MCVYALRYCSEWIGKMTIIFVVVAAFDSGLFQIILLLVLHTIDYQTDAPRLWMIIRSDILFSFSDQKLGKQKRNNKCTRQCCTGRDASHWDAYFSVILLWKKKDILHDWTYIHRASVWLFCHLSKQFKTNQCTYDFYRRILIL